MNPTSIDPTLPATEEWEVGRICAYKAVGEERAIAPLVVKSKWLAITQLAFAMAVESNKLCTGDTPIGAVRWDGSDELQ
ncbi:hypothetical protein BN946_scf184815.g61 [Trametes cinnabarina]|uniref:Uncharacterized protein n=1 Tax=Pycnoporus cinnabarinus TaxID=5643 RepID=A0A060S819_PYCCI|nr:hypothetical protein BN946_scf184815.g61 [Trametes cinnabarina]